VVDTPSPIVTGHGEKCGILGPPGQNLPAMIQQRGSPFINLVSHYIQHCCMANIITMSIARNFFTPKYTQGRLSYGGFGRAISQIF